MDIKTMIPSKEDYLSVFRNMDVETLQKLFILACDWKPTTDNINRLPDGIRDFVMQLETIADPSGIVRENIILRDLVERIDIQALLKDGSIQFKSKAMNHEKTPYQTNNHSDHNGFQNKSG